LFRGFLLFGENEKRAVCARFGGRWSFFVRFFFSSRSRYERNLQGTCVGCLFRKKKEKVVDPKFDKKYCFFLNVYNKTEFHALLHRGQALNAYEAKMHLDNGTLDFGHGLDFESGKTKKAEKRPPTQIEIMASMEREKQAKKEERRLAREAKKQARLEQEEFIRNGGNIKLSKKEKRRLEAEMEN
tara:strand:+ start:277 stop:831 length:555 start_codon:yes stop_codon:yes gene_type:complete